MTERRGLLCVYAFSDAVPPITPCSFARAPRRRVARARGIPFGHTRSVQPMATAMARRTSALGRCRPQCSPARRRVLFDVGSNNGAWAAVYLRTHPDAAAFLLEPNPRFEEELSLIQTRYDAVHVRAAAWIADGNATFHFSRNDESSSLIAGMIRCNARS